MTGVRPSQKRSEQLTERCGGYSGSPNMKHSSSLPTLGQTKESLMDKLQRELLAPPGRVSPDVVQAYWNGSPRSASSPKVNRRNRPLSAKSGASQAASPLRRAPTAPAEVCGTCLPAHALRPRSAGSIGRPQSAARPKSATRPSSATLRVESPQARPMPPPVHGSELPSFTKWAYGYPAVGNSRWAPQTAMPGSLSPKSGYPTTRSPTSMLQDPGEVGSPKTPSRPRSARSYGGPLKRLSSHTERFYADFGDLSDEVECSPKTSASPQRSRNTNDWKPKPVAKSPAKGQHHDFDNLDGLQDPESQEWSQRVLSGKSKFSVSHQDLMKLVDEVLLHASHLEAEEPVAPGSPNSLSSPSQSRRRTEDPMGDSRGDAKPARRVQVGETLGLLDSAAGDSSSAESDDGGVESTPPAVALAKRGNVVASQLDMEKVNEAKLHGIFLRFSHLGELNADHLPEALQPLAVKKVNQAWVKEILEEYYDDRSFIDLNEFKAFVAHYTERESAWLDKAFKEADQDGSGSISLPEIDRLMRARGYTPSAGSIKDLFREVTGSESLRDLTFNEFVLLVELVEERAGFPRREFLRLKALFHRHDLNNSRRLNDCEIWALLCWEGLSQPHGPIITEMVNEVSTSGHVDFPTFLQIMRRYREWEVGKVMEAFQNHDSHWTGVVAEERLGLILEDLGYKAVDPQALEELMSGIHARRSQTLEPGLSLEDVRLAMDRYRETDGFLWADLQELRAVYQQFTTSKGLGPIEMEAALRWCGFPALLWEIQELFDKVDVDGTGWLTEDEFVKLLARIRESEIEALRAVAERDGNSTTMSMACFITSLPALGYSWIEENSLPLEFEVSAADINVWQAARLLRVYRQHIRTAILAREGFSPQEVLQFQSCFSRHDPRSSGLVKDIAKLLQEVCPEAQTAGALRQNVQTVLKELCKNSTFFDFATFLHFLRLVSNQSARDRVAEEKEVIAASGFSRDETAEFRRIFNRSVAGPAAAGGVLVQHGIELRADLHIEVVEDMIAGIVGNVKDESRSELRSILQELDSDKNNALTFGEFLLSMRRVLDENWQGINEAAAVAAQAGHHEMTEMAPRKTMTPGWLLGDSLRVNRQQLS